MRSISSLGIPVLGGLIVPAVLLVAWETCARAGLLPSSISSPPTSIVKVFCTLVVSGVLVKHAVLSITRLCVAVFIGTLLGTLSGMTLANSRMIDRLIGPTISSVAPVPVVVWIPFIVVLFGTDESYKVSLVSFASFLLVHMHVYQAVKLLPQEYTELSDLYEKTMLQRFLKVYLPASSTGIIAGIRLSFSIGWIVIFFAEYGTTQEGLGGLGWFIADSRQVGRISEQFAGVLALAICGLVTDAVVLRLQDSLLVWQNRAT